MDSRSLRSLEEVSTTQNLTIDNLPKGNMWDEHGACFRAEIDPRVEDGWWWRPVNAEAVRRGYSGQALFDHYMPKEIKLPPRTSSERK